MKLESVSELKFVIMTVFVMVVEFKFKLSFGTDLVVQIEVDYRVIFITEEW